MIIRILTQICLFASFLWLPTVSANDIKSFISQAVDQSYRMQVARSRRLLREKELHSAKSAYRPNINLSFELAGEKEPNQDQRNFYGPGLAIDYNLLSWDRSARVGLSQQNLANSEKELLYSHNDILFQVINLVYDYHLAKELEAIAEKNMQSLKKNMDMVQRKVKAGDVSKVNYQRSKARFFAAKGQKLQAGQTIKNIRYRFKALSELEVPDELGLPVIKNTSFNDPEEVKNSVTFQRFNQQLKVFGKQIKIARAKEYPRISLRVTHNEEVGLSANDSDDYDSRAILAVEWPLYTGGKITADIKSAIVSKVVQEKERDIVGASLLAEYKTLSETIETEKKALREYQTAAETAEKVLEGRRFEFNNGGGRNDLVLDAEREYLSFKRSEANSRFAIKKSYLRLLYRTGKLSLENIVAAKGKVD